MIRNPIILSVALLSIFSCSDKNVEKEALESLSSLELETVNAVRIITADTNSYPMVLRSQNCLYQANASTVKAGEIMLQLISFECGQETTQIHPDDALATITVDAIILRNAIIADVRNEIEAGTMVDGSPWMHLESKHSSSL